MPGKREISRANGERGIMDELKVAISKINLELDEVLLEIGRECIEEWQQHRLYDLPGNPSWTGKLSDLVRKHEFLVKYRSNLETSRDLIKDFNGDG